MTIFSNPGGAKQFNRGMASRRDSITFSSQEESTQYSTATSTSTPTSTSRRTPDIFKRLVYQHRYGTQELHTESLVCLESDAYLTDNIIQFYLIYLWNMCSDTLADKIHIFDTIFFSKLTAIFNPKKIDSIKLDQLSKWSRNVDIFSKDFLIFPVCHDDHWFVIVVCYPNEVKEAFRADKTNGFLVDDEDYEDDEPVEVIIDGADCQADVFHNALENLEQINSSGPPPAKSTHPVKKIPCIIVMDSLGVKNVEFTDTIRDFLDYEWRSRPDAPIKRFHNYDLRDYFPSLPKQPNAHDCGMYVCHYSRCFLNDPYEFCRLVRLSNSRSRSTLKSKIQAYIDEIDREKLRTLILDICTRD